MGTTISTPAGFFQSETVTPASAKALQTLVTAANANLITAQTAATNATNSATAASNSAAAALASQQGAAGSVTSASNSAASASASASTATTQAGNASTSATAASTSATAASGSASTASTQAGNANTSAGNAATSATTAATEATAATTSATTAATQAGNATSSATSAASSVTTASLGASNATTSAAAAATSATKAAAISPNPNLIHNGRFNIQVRYAGAVTTGGTWLTDRWYINSLTGTTSYSLVALADSDRSAIGDETAMTAFQAVTTVAGTMYFQQPMEHTHSLAGKTLTLSFWGRGVGSAQTLGIGVEQHFGTGGTPSSPFPHNVTQASLTTSWAQYTYTFTVPTAIGKNWGTNANTDFTNLEFYVDNTSGAPAGGTAFSQTGTIQLWGIKLEAASVATPLNPMDPLQDQEDCQRFYIIMGPLIMSGYGSAASQIEYGEWTMPTTMRLAPTVNAVNGGSGTVYVNGSTLISGGSTTDSFRLSYTIAAAGVTSCTCTIALDGDFF